MAHELSEGALSTIMNGGQVESPIMQILGSKKISGAGDSERYRLLVSDGVHVNSFAMLATQLNDRIRNGDLADNTIVRIKRFITSVVPNSGKGEKRVMIILDVEVVAPGSEVGNRIGNPVSWSPDAPAASGPSRPANGPSTNGPSSNGLSTNSPPSCGSAASARPQSSSCSTAAAAASSHAPPSRPSPVKPSNAGGYGGGYGNNLRSPAKGMGGMDINPNGHTHPIASLTPYQNKWVIKARVTSKTPIRTWNNSRGEGKLFSFDLVDESGEIRVTAFKEQCDRFFDMIEIGKVYCVTRAQLKTANKKFTNLNNDYEMTLGHDSQILTVMEDDGGVPQIKYNFVSLDQVESMEKDTTVDVIGIVKSVGDVLSFTSKANKEFKKREVTVVDKSNTAVNVTLWGQLAEDFDGSNQCVVAVKGGRVNEFQGAKSVSLPQNATLQVNPDIPESHQLKGWFDEVGSTAEFKSISLRAGGSGGMGNDGKLITLKDARDQGLGNDGKSDYFSCKATIIMCKSENAIYQACPGENCNKKVLDQHNGLYRCEKCNREYPNYTPRLLLQMSVGDWTDNTWVTAFKECAEVILSKSSEEMDELKINSPDGYQQVFQQATFKSFTFRMRAQVQTYNDEQRLKTSVVDVKKIDYKAYCASLLTQLKEITGMGAVSK